MLILVLSQQLFHPFHLYKGTSPVRKRPPPSDLSRTLSIGLQGPRGGWFLTSEVPLYGTRCFRRFFSAVCTGGQPNVFYEAR